MCVKNFTDVEAAYQNRLNDENLTLPAGHWFPFEPKPSDPKYQAWNNSAGREYGFALDHLRWEQSVRQIKLQIEAEKLNQERKASEEKQRKLNLGQCYKMYCPDCEGQVEVLVSSMGKQPCCPHCKREMVPVFSKESPRENIIPVHVVKPVGSSIDVVQRMIRERVKRESVERAGAGQTPEPLVEVPSQGVTIQESETNPTTTTAGQLDEKIIDHDWRNAPVTERQKENSVAQSVNGERLFKAWTDANNFVTPGHVLIFSHAEHWWLITAEAYRGFVDVKIAERILHPPGTAIVEVHEIIRGKEVPDQVRAAAQEVTIQEATIPQNTSPRENIPEAPEHLRQHCEMYCPVCDGLVEVPQGTVGKKRACPHCQLEISLIFSRKNPQKNTIMSREVQNSTQRSPANRKPAVDNIPNFNERFGKQVEAFLERDKMCVGCHWLPLGPLYIFTSGTFLLIGSCRQIADTIESKGYCVEPDARFGSGTYDSNQTLALFKPFDGDPIQPSTAYLGAANLLRLCVLIATADGRIDLVELDVFRQAIENQIGLTQTDHKRLIILKQLLAQELCSTSKTVARIAKSVPTEKRLVIGKLLVEVAAAKETLNKAKFSNFSLC